MRNENYKMLQIPTEAHSILKEYCRSHGYKMGKLVERLILKEIGTTKSKQFDRPLPSRSSN